MVYCYLPGGLHFNLIERLIIKITMDYLPSSWHTYYEDSIADVVLQWFLPLLLTALTYFFLYKRNKLPYPSIFSNKHVQ